MQTNLTMQEIDGYLRRKWGRDKEVSQVVCELNKQKFEDEIDEISSIASCSRWSDASAISDLEDVDLENSVSNVGPQMPGCKSNVAQINDSVPSPPQVAQSNLSRLISRCSSPQIAIRISHHGDSPPAASSSLSNVDAGPIGATAQKKRRHRPYCSNAVMIQPLTSSIGPRPDFGRSMPQFIHSSESASNLADNFSR